MLNLKGNRNICLDSCSLINLLNCGHLDNILSLTGYTFFVGPSVYDEVAKIEEQKLILDEYIEKGVIQKFSGNLSLERIETLFEVYGLGDGETESVIICSEFCYDVCCDDRLARKMAEDIIGKSRTMGSLRLLKFAVDQEKIICTEAYAAYKTMIEKGGFLPKEINHHFFCNPS